MEERKNEGESCTKAETDETPGGVVRIAADSAREDQSGSLVCDEVPPESVPAHIPRRPTLHARNDEAQTRRVNPRKESGAPDPWKSVLSTPKVKVQSREVQRSNGNSAGQVLITLPRPENTCNGAQSAPKEPRSLPTRPHYVASEDPGMYTVVTPSMDAYAVGACLFELLFAEEARPRDRQVDHNLFLRHCSAGTGAGKSQVKSLYITVASDSALEEVLVRGTGDAMVTPHRPGLEQQRQRGISTETLAPLLRGQPHKVLLQHSAFRGLEHGHASQFYQLLFARDRCSEEPLNLRRQSPGLRLPRQATLPACCAGRVLKSRCESNQPGFPEAVARLDLMNVITNAMLADNPAERLSVFEALAFWPKAVANAQ